MVTFQKFIILKYSNLLIMSHGLCCHRFHYKPTAFLLLSKQKKKNNKGDGEELNPGLSDNGRWMNRNRVKHGKDG